MRRPASLAQVSIVDRERSCPHRSLLISRLLVTNLPANEGSILVLNWLVPDSHLPEVRLPSSAARPRRLSFPSSRIEQVRPARSVCLRGLILSMCSRLPWAEPTCSLLRLSPRSQKAIALRLVRPLSCRACFLEQTPQSSQQRSQYGDPQEGRPCHEISLAPSLPIQGRSAPSTT